MKKNDISCKGKTEGGELKIKYRNDIHSSDFPMTFQLVNLTTNKIYRNFETENSKKLQNENDTIISKGKFDIADELTKGNYRIIVRAKGCNYVYQGEDMVISEPGDSLKLEIKDEDGSSFCKDNGNIQLEATYGWGDYKYFLEQGGSKIIENKEGLFLDLAPGIYTCGVIDEKGCEVKVSKNVIRYSKYNITVNQPKDILCKGGSTHIVINPDLTNYKNPINNEQYNIEITGTPPSNFEYGDSVHKKEKTFKNLKAGNYTISVKTLDGCINTQNISIREPNALKIDSIIVESPIICYGKSADIRVYASGGTPALSYRSKYQDIQGNLITGSWNTTELFSLNKGEYTFEVKDRNGCEISSNVFFLNGPDTSSSIRSGRSILSEISCNEVQMMHL